MNYLILLLICFSQFSFELDSNVKENILYMSDEIFAKGNKLNSLDLSDVVLSSDSNNYIKTEYWIFVILNFIENLRTAYEKKDLKYIERSLDGAINIVGRVIKVEKGNIKLEGNVENKKVEMVKFSITGYIHQLGTTFKRNLFIKLKFDSIEVTQSRTDTNFYAINLIQEWHSLTHQGKAYKDKGYGFFLIDFTNEEKPMIHVRAWEPYNQTKKEEKISIGDFDIN